MPVLPTEPPSATAAPLPPPKPLASSPPPATSPTPPSTPSAAAARKVDDAEAARARARRRVASRERPHAGNPRVARLQDALTRLGYYHGPASGELDGATLDAIRTFQRKLGDPPTGVMTATEVIRLLNS